MNHMNQASKEGLINVAKARYQLVPNFPPRFPFLERKPFKRNRWESAEGMGNDLPK